MKNYILLLLASFFMGGCDHSSTNTFGEAFDSSGAKPVADLYKMMEGQDSLSGVFTTTIKQTCTKAGFWMDVNGPNGEVMTVFMKDHGFAVPLEGCEGLPATFNGKAYYTTLDVDYLRHLAEDAGKSQAEIDAITEPQQVLAFDATGVTIEGYKDPHAGHNHAPGEHHDHDGHDHEGHNHQEGESH